MNEMAFLKKFSTACGLAALEIMIDIAMNDQDFRMKLATEYEEETAGIEIDRWERPPIMRDDEVTAVLKAGEYAISRKDLKFRTDKESLHLIEEIKNYKYGARK